jgi:ABC-2 type transport system permease protein/sodium transport system permease protein
LALKELRETLRDRRTVGTLVLMPLLVYPLLGVTFQKFFLSQAALQGPNEYIVALESFPAAMEFRQLFSTGNQLLGRELEPGKPLPTKPGEPAEPTLRFLYPDDPNATVNLPMMLETHQADLGVAIRESEQGRQRRLELTRLQGSSLGEGAERYVIERLRAVNEEFVRRYLAEQPERVALPLAWEPKSLKSSAPTGFSLATLVPLVLILMTVTGAVYPAIDLTAGERERGTLEAMIAAPISRRSVLLAKYVAVVTVALLTAVVNVTAMVATAYGTGMEQILFGSAGLSLALLAQLLLLLGVFAGFFSAVILAITSIARSFKEAQAYLIPVMLLSLSPGVLALMPGLELTVPLALTPLLNMVVLSRELLDGRAPVVPMMVTLVSTITYAGVALAIAARIFGTDAVLYGGSGSWSELWKSPTEQRETPTLSHGLWALGVLFPAYILLGSLPGRLGEVSIGTRLLVSAGLTTLLFAVWPLLLAARLRIRWSTGLGLRPASLVATFGAIVAGCSLWPFAYEVEILTVSPDRLKFMVELFKGFEAELRQVPIAIKLLCLSAAPACCEELFFRGFLFRALRSTAGPWLTIGVTATMFGLFHVLVRDALLFERFLPTALMGVVLGWVAQRTDSVLPGVLLHVTHNSLLLLLPDLAPTLGDWTAATARSHLPPHIMLIAAGGAIIGLGLIWLVTRQLIDRVERDLPSTRA